MYMKCYSKYQTINLQHSVFLTERPFMLDEICQCNISVRQYQTTRFFHSLITCSSAINKKSLHIHNRHAAKIHTSDDIYQFCYRTLTDYQYGGIARIRKIRIFVTSVFSKSFNQSLLVDWNYTATITKKYTRNDKKKKSTEHSLQTCHALSLTAYSCVL